MHTKKILRPALFICAGLTLVTLTFAGVVTQLQAPSKPGRPLVIDIQKDGGVVKYLAPLNDGGTPVTKYFIQYKGAWGWKWKYRGTSTTLQYTLKNIKENSLLQFRVCAENQIGVSPNSGIGDPVTFRSPFKDK